MRGGEGLGEVAGVVAIDIEWVIDEEVDEGTEDEKEYEEGPGEEKRAVDFDVGKPFSSLTLSGKARYCALSVVTRIACLSKSLSGTPLGRKLSKASKARNPFSCLGGEREYGEGWVTDILRSFFRWIFPDDEGEVGNDVVEFEEKGEPFGGSRECEESRNLRGWTSKGEERLCTVFPFRSTNKKGSETVNSPVSLHSASWMKRYSLADKGGF